MPAGERVALLVEVMDRLRSAGGCPWDARQTHRSLVEYLVEETYEAVEAIETDDRDGLREELGDVLLQVVFHARIAAEDPDDPWTIDDVADGIVAKLIDRHPHVFTARAPMSEADSEAVWHARKTEEKRRESVLDGIPSALPALVLAAKVLARSAALTDGLPDQRAAELAGDLVHPLTSEEEFGDLLFALVAAGRARGFDAESATRGAARRRIEIVRQVERSLRAGAER